jgi:hypothetical protein
MAEDATGLGQREQALGSVSLTDEVLQGYPQDFLAAQLEGEVISVEGFPPAAGQMCPFDEMWKLVVHCTIDRPGIGQADGVN